MSLQQGIPRNIIVPSTQNSTQSDEPIYILTIELEQGKTTELKIYINSIPEELSYHFCHQHNLDYHSLNYLTEQIKILINEHKTKQNSLEVNTTTNNNVIKDQPHTQTESKTSSLKTAPIPSHHRNRYNNNNNNNDLSSYHSSVNSTHKKQRHHSSKQISTTKEHIKHASSLSHKTNYNESKSSTNNKHKLLITTNNHFSIHSNISSKLQNESELLHQQQQQQHDNNKLSDINNKLKIESDNNSYTFKGGKQLTSSSYIVTDNNCKSNDYHKKRKGRSYINNSNSLYTNTNNNTTHDNKSFTSNCIKDKQKVITPFTTRQSMYRKQSEAKYHKIRNELYPPVDNKTGQLFFHPKLYNQHKHMTHLNNYSNIFNNLYAYAEKYKDNQYKRDNKMKHEILDMSNMKKMSDNSNEILQRKKNEIFKRIFRCFDVDEDGLISIFTIDTKKIPNDIYQIIKPIIEELKEYQGSITENEFVNECNILFDVSYLYIYIYIYVILL